LPENPSIKLAKNKKFRVTTLKILPRLIGVVILIILLTKVDTEQLIIAIRNIRTDLFIYAVILVIPVYLFKSMRWNFLMHMQGIKYSYLQALLAFTSSNFIGFITPGRMGEMAKAIYVRNDKKLPLASVIPSVLVDRLFDVYILIFITLLGFFKLSLFGDVDKLFYFGIFLIMLLPLIAIKKSWTYPLLLMISKSRFFKKYTNKIKDFGEAFFVEIQKMLNIRIIIPLFLTIMAYFSLFFSGFMLIKAMNIDVTFSNVAIIISIGNVLSFIPISFSGIGTRDAAFVFIFGILGLASEDAIAFSVLILITFFVFGGLYGFICYSVKPISLSLNQR